MKQGRDYPPIVGVGDIGAIVGLKDSTVRQYHAVGILPPHDMELNQGRTKAWYVETILMWDESRAK